jgi:DNA-binding SARP family transcriptional activator
MRCTADGRPRGTEDAMFEIGLFGTTHVRAGVRVLRFEQLPATKPRQLLEILAVARGAIVCKPALAERIWAGRPTARWQAALDTHVSVLRRALQPGVAGRRTVIRTTAGGYRLDPDSVLLDLDTFDELVTTAETAPPAEALRALERAVELGQRDVLEHEPYADWASECRRDYRRRLVEAAVRGARAGLACGRLEPALRLARVAVARDPLCEEGWQAVIDVHGRSGRRADAIRAFQDCQRALVREFGISPGSATHRALHAALDRTQGPRPPVEAPGRARSGVG